MGTARLVVEGLWCGLVCGPGPATDSNRVQGAFAFAPRRKPPAAVMDTQTMLQNFEHQAVVCPRPSPLKSPLKMKQFDSPPSRRLRFSKEVEEAEKELSQILSSSDANAQTATSSRSSPGAKFLESPEPRARYSNEQSPFSPFSRAENPDHSSSPYDTYVASEGAELGLLAVSPERSRHRKRMSAGRVRF